MPKLCVNNVTKTRKRITIILAFLLVNISNVAFNVAMVTSTLPVHNINTGLDYATIQEAIDAPETLEGHTIKADAGTYHERVMMYKNNLTILGENPRITTIDSQGIGEVVYITANNIYLSEFTIRNGWCGIYIDYSGNNTLKENIITDNWRGIYLGYSCNNTFIRSTITDNSEYGILLSSSSNNVIYHNNFIDNTVQAESEMSDNTWDGGYPSGGNHWSNHVCEGNPSNGSQPYIIDENNIDHYPFQDPIGWLPPSSPVSGIRIPIDKLDLLTLYICTASTVFVASVVTIVYVKHRMKRE